MTENTIRSSPRVVANGVDSDMAVNEAVKDPMALRQTLELVRVYYTIEDTGIRRSAADIVKSIAAALPTK